MRLFVQILYRLLRHRSISIRFKVTWIVTIIIYWLYRKGRIRIKRNVSLIRPDLNNRQIAQGALRVAKTITRSWAAMLGNEFTTLEEVKKKLEVENMETLLELLRAGKKVIATAAHIGPVDEIAGVIPLYNLRVYVPAEPVDPRWLFNLMMRLRLRLGDIIYEPVEKGATLTRAAHYLNKGRIVLFVVDVPRRDKSGVLCRIGKAKARFSVGAVKLALEEAATIIPVFPSWGRNWRVKITIGSPFELIRTGDRNQDIETNTRRLIEEVYAPYIRANWDSWLRLLWGDLEPVEPDEDLEPSKQALVEEAMSRTQTKKP